MKRYFVIISILGLAVLGAATLYTIVNAQQSAPMTEAHIQRIRNNCVKAQTSLSRLHASDALLRVNRGQLYESMSTKLMAPFNSRVALNRLDSMNLPAIASQYEQALAAFRTTYQQYEESMTDTLDLNCVNQPVAFYDSVTETRDKRSLVHQKTIQLHELVQKYKTEFEAFADQYKESNQ